MEPSDFEAFAGLIQLGFFLLVLIATFFIGTAMEKAHYRSIREREARLLAMPTTNFPNIPVNWSAARGELVTGSVVVSIDYFKGFLAKLRNLIGGRVKSYETLLDRGRREAILRMKEEALARGYNAVVNVRLETSRLASSKKNGQGVAGVEVLAFGTALRVRSTDSP